MVGPGCQDSLGRPIGLGGWTGLAKMCWKGLAGRSRGLAKSEIAKGLAWRKGLGDEGLGDEGLAWWKGLAGYVGLAKLRGLAEFGLE